MCLKNKTKQIKTEQNSANLELSFRDKAGKKKGEKKPNPTTKKREAVLIFIYSLNVYEFSGVSRRSDLTLGSLGLTMIFWVSFPFAH